MRILGIDTSTLIGSIALLLDGQLVVETSERVSSGHAGFLLPSISALLEQASWKIDQLDAIACAIGPGSFAGLRIGIATVKGLAFASKTATVGINTLEAMALSSGAKKLRICPILDAKKEQVYVAFFQMDGQGGLERLSEDLALEPKALADRLDPETLLIGDGAQKYAALFQKKLGDRALFAKENLCYHNGRSVAQLGLRKLRYGVTDSGLYPNYVRPPDAKECKEKLERSPNGDSR